MIFLYLGIYTAFIVAIWGVFIVVWIHSMKFKNFNLQIPHVLRILLVIMIVMTITGYILILFDSDLRERTDIEIEIPLKPSSSNNEISY